MQTITETLSDARHNQSPTCYILCLCSASGSNPYAVSCVCYPQHTQHHSILCQHPTRCTAPAFHLLGSSNLHARSFPDGNPRPRWTLSIQHHPTK